MKSHFQLTVIEGGNPHKVTLHDIHDIQRVWLRFMWVPFDIALAMWLAPIEATTRAMRGPRALR